MFPYLAFGHINPLLQLARSPCATGSGVRITFLSANANVPQIESLLPASMSTSVVLIHLSAVLGLPLGVDSTADLSPASPAAKLLKPAVDGTRPQVESLLRELRPHLVVFDFGMQWLPEVAEPLDVWTLFFFFVFVVISTAYLTAPARRVHGPAPTLDDIMSPPPGFPPSLCSNGR
ncbi:unnamed protein product [Musa acuminata subsp. malaccensis]|uniref:(wild Malaysian banana) hypothetical protein n=1 Tax=Musa acuminata subsp. malaccensis TaxID=214687 RepID=A0A804J510_MUSAM|nr:PREDICTED: anthocyanidin 3-O-glucosyltransferase-like [Musa acuminata subsp. malaccensis]CAG1838608.1 unnamed protein product [Musa acuminata subsp. malaccensis]